MGMHEINKAALEGERVRKDATIVVREHVRTLSSIVSNTEAMTRAQLKLAGRAAREINKNVRETTRKLK